VLAYARQRVGLLYKQGVVEMPKFIRETVYERALRRAGMTGIETSVEQPAAFSGNEQAPIRNSAAGPTRDLRDARLFDLAVNQRQAPDDACTRQCTADASSCHHSPVQDDSVFRVTLIMSVRGSDVLCF